LSSVSVPEPTTRPVPVPGLESVLLEMLLSAITLVDEESHPKRTKFNATTNHTFL